MKKYYTLCVIVFLNFPVVGQVQQTVNVPAPTPYTIVSRDANSQIWEQTNYVVSPSGQIVPKISSYTELATGLNYKEPATGQWVPSQEVINILPDGSGAATNGQHQAYFPGNIYNGVITLITPDGTQLQSQPIGLSYSDGTNSVLIAALTNSVGELISSNQVLYPDAFVGVKADLLYTYTIGGFEQDIIIEEQPPAPEDFNLNSENSWLQMETEFFDTPQPTVTGESDDWLGFGTMEMVPGKAFLLGTNEQDNGIKVGKSWVNVSGRQILVEQVPVMALADELSQLPAPQNATTKANPALLLNVVSAKRLLPEPRPIQTKHQPLLMTKTEHPSKAVVFDYVILNSIANKPFTFQGDTTYYISSAGFTLAGTGSTVIEGGAVIKYTNNTSVAIYNNLITPTNAYRPAIFTSMNDNSVGAPINNSTGNPTNTGSYDLYISFENIPTNAMLSNLRFSYAGTAVWEYSGGVSSSNCYPVWNCQFINCGTAFSLEDYDNLNQLTLQLYNVLFSNCGTVLTNADAFYDGDIKLAGQNITVDNANILVGTWKNGSSDDPQAGASTLTNSILTGVQHQVSYAGAGSPYYVNLSNTNSCYVGNNSGIYQMAGVGNYYLATDSPCRNAGTINISPALLAELQQRTTWPPVIYARTNISVPATFNPQAQRDNSDTALDLGYHYDPLDYIFGGCDFSNNVTFTTGTAVGWYETNGAVLSEPYGISLDEGAILSFSGNATLPCYFARYTMVQENGNKNWTNSGLGGVILNGNGSLPVPQLSGNFTKFIADAPVNIVSGDSAYGAIGFLNCEFYDAELASYASSACFSNCLFFRNFADFYDQYTNTAFVFEDCTFYNGGLGMARTNSFPHSNWQVENTSFDGTDFSWEDYWHGTNYTTFDYNAYNTNNFSWTNYAYLSPATNGLLELTGGTDQMVTNYNWQTSWFGTFYLPPDSPIITMGSTQADFLGLAQFTTQTNTADPNDPEGNATVDIGYHYVATDGNGNPLDTSGDGIPDYILDANGNGAVDSGEIAWNIFGDLGLSIIITKPPNNSIIP